MTSFIGVFQFESHEKAGVSVAGEGRLLSLVVFQFGRR